MKRLLRPFIDEVLMMLCHGLFLVTGFTRLLLRVMLAEPDLTAEPELSDERTSSATLLEVVEVDDANPWLRVDLFKPSLRQ